MNNKFQSILEQLVPFLVFGFIIAILIGLFFMLSYLIIWGAVIGVVIWLVSLIKNYFSPKDNKHGRVIEHDDKDDK